jgi:SAM-dependent methyltransferase
LHSIDGHVDGALLDILRCPVCGAELSPEAAGIACSRCGRAFSIADGMPLMLHDDLPGAREKKRECEGWVAKARSEGWYDANDELDRSLPFVYGKCGCNDLTWLGSGHSFQVLLDRYVGEECGLRVLEVGAARAWAGPYWRERDCTYVATDILVDSHIGLGRGAFYGDFARVQADGEHLPFAGGAFDLVYCVATLHHALDLRAMVRELARVARPGGVVAVLNEGTRGFLRSADNPDQRDEKALGINEHVHPVWAYLAALRRAGLAVRRVERSDGWPPVPFGGALARLPKVGLTLGTLAHVTAAGYVGISIYARKR